MATWEEVLESGELTKDVVESAIDWRSCPVGVFHPQFVARRRGAFDVTPGCPPKLTKLGIQFMDCVEAGERQKAIGVLRKIATFQTTP